jgi:hypothetical protein
VESMCFNNDKTTVETGELVEELKVLFETDYAEFVRDRKRWKSEFDIATNKALSNFDKIEGLLTNCLN